MDPRALRQLFSALEARRQGLSQNVALPRCDLRGAYLLRADLVGADLAGARLDHANLAGAKLGRAALAGTRLVGAELNGADLTGADLRDADLSAARVEGACFADADLRGASLSAALGMPASVAGARIDAATCDKSGFTDAVVVRWHRLGASVEKLEDFSNAVRHACSTPSSVPGELAPDLLREAELGARRAKLERESLNPPSARHADALRRLSLPPTSRPSLAPPAEQRSSVPDELLSAIRASLPPRAAGEVLGVELAEELTPGSVWVGKRPDGASVLVRVCNPERSGALGAALFQRGVRAMNRAALELGDEAGLLRLLAVGTTELAIVTEYLPNGNLSGVSALNLSTRDRVSLFIKLCKTVARLHEAGILHRCLKPSNVLLDDRLDPVVAELDMVDVAELAAIEGTAGGYAAYAAPEELIGSGTHSPTADVYSLGRILHFLLLGVDPADAVEDVPTLEALRRQPAGLTRIVRKCTLRDPGARYQWVGELIEDLMRYEAHQEVGLAGANEGNFLPYAISSLAPPPLARVAVGGYQAPPLFERAGKSRRIWLSRAAEKRVALGAGVLGCLLSGSFLAVQIPADRAGLVAYAAALAFALVTLALPAFGARPVLSRLSIAALAFLAVAALEPQRLATLRWRFQLASDDPSVRADAVPRLTRAGARVFAGVDLSGVALTGVDLSQADFRGARLSDADVSRSALMESDFGDADLTNARALGADFTGAKVEHARGFESIQCDDLTALPAGWACVLGRPAKSTTQ